MNLLFQANMDCSSDLIGDDVDFVEMTSDLAMPTDENVPQELTVCKVCGDSATGMYFGAQVCVPCKTFFLRYASDSSSFTCKFNKFCIITPANRTQCKYCRYQKCVEAGMCRRVRPMQVQVTEGQQICAVCSDVANGIHFGALTCEGCKKFFRRGLTEHKTYACKADQTCVINPRTRNACRYCRYVKCISVGMSREAIQMGRPSKHKAQANALLRQNSAKHTKVEEGQGLMATHNGWVSNGHLNSDMNHLASSANMETQHNNGDDWSPNEVYVDRRPSFTSKHRSLSIGSSNTVSDGVSVDDSESSSIGADVKSEFSSFSPELRHSTTGSNSSVTFAWGRPSYSSSAKSHVRSASVTDGMQTDSKRVLSPDQMSRVRVWSGGYCCEMSGSTNDTKPEFANKTGHFDDSWSTLHSLMTGGSKANASPALNNRHDMLHVETDNERVTDSSPQFVSFSAAAGDAKPKPIVISPDQSFCEPAPPMSTRSRGPSPGIRWQVTNDRNSPYVSVMALASSCHLFSEASRGSVAESATQDVSTDLVVDNTASQCTDVESMYWLQPELPDENIMWIEKHCEMLNRIRSAYDRFVHTGTMINETLTQELKNWRQLNADHSHNLPGWIQSKVIPVYTVTSITYCKSLPGFTDFSTDDQASLIRLGQSPSRILVACIHWYDADTHSFHNFLSWRTDLFKKKLLDCAQKIHKLDIDPVEAAVLNALTLIATDYPGLKNAQQIEELRKSMLSAFRAYTTAKLGTPNKRIETLFRHMPEVRQLGMLHYKMTMTASLKAEEIEKH